MFFSAPGEYPACGMYNFEHLKLIIVTTLAIIAALLATSKKDKEKVLKIIKRLTITIWILEAIKIVFTLKYEDIRNVNTYVPLYFCSLLLYASALSSFAKGKLKHAGDVFLATGGIVGGIIFMLCPSTSLPSYPALHFVSIHSYIYHGIMVYIGLLVNITRYVEIEKSDIKYYAALVGSICILAFIVNKIFDSNLMFISKSSSIRIIKELYNVTGPFFTIIAMIAQMTLPFYFIYEIKKLQQANVSVDDSDKQEFIQKGV